MKQVPKEYEENKAAFYLEDGDPAFALNEMPEPTHIQKQTSIPPEL